MFMGQKYAKEAKLTFKSSSSKKTKQNSGNNKETEGAVHFSIHQGTSTTATATTLSVPAAAVGTQANDLKTGNLVIAIRMLTMNPNDTTTTTMNTAPTGSGDGACRVEDDTSNNNNNNEIFDHSSASVIDVLDIINSSSSSSSSSSNNSSSKDSQSNSTLQSSSSVSDTCSESSDVCDTLQNTVSPTFINLTAQQPQTTTAAAAHSISASCSSCAGNSSLADKLNSMLSSSRCKVQGASVPLSQGCSTKVKAKKSNWSLGKLTGLSKREKKKQQLVSCPEETDHGIEKTDVPCYWLNGVGVGVGDDNNHIPEPMVINSSELPSIPTPTTTTATVQSNSVKYPRAQPLPLINGTLPPATSSTAQAAAAAATFIYPDPNRAATTATPTPGVATTTPTPTTFLHSRATLYGSLSNGTSGGNFFILSPFIDTRTVVTQEDYSLEDLDEQLRWRRALQIAEGIEAPPGFIPRSEPVPQSTLGTPIWQTVVTDAASLQSFIGHISKLSLSPEEVIPRGIHSQADYIHCLVPDLEKIINCNFYWGKMDRFEAEKLLDGKPEGTFLLRDSAQEDFLFSVSFRKYGRSLHARVEQFNHEFSFDSHDPGVHTAKTVTGLLEHYKDPSCVMFFEPMLTSPLNRNFVFSLQELARATIVSKTTYDDIDKLGLPKKLCFYMREYHYRQRVHVKRFDGWDS